MDVLYETEVVPEQIDHLGHMNVRFYGEHARAGAAKVLEGIGLVGDEGRTVVQRDSYTRHHNEQLLGAPLVVRGGVLDATPDQVRLYEELANSATGDLAASFVLSFELAARTTRRPEPLPAAVVTAACASTVSVPAHGAPRSVSIDEELRPGPTLEQLRARDLAVRLPRTIEASECDDDGFVLPLKVSDLVWGGEPVSGQEFRPLETLAEGGQMGFATMETRATWLRAVRAGDVVQSHAAQLEMYEKAALSRHWLMDVERGDAVAVFSVVSLAFDLTARRAMRIPDDVRRRFERRLHPELAAG